MASVRQCKWWVRERLQSLAPRSTLRLLARRSWLHEAEIVLLPMLAPRGSVAVDAGANKGIYTYHLARNFDSVVAFEPLPSLALFLQRAVPANVTVHPIALSNRAGLATLRLPSGYNELSTVEPERAFGVDGATRTEQHRVATAPLDAFELERVGVLKVDVEGHELAVLQGARRLIATSRPTVIVELEERHRSNAVADVREFFARMGFDGFFLDGIRLRPMNEFDARRDQNADALENAVKVGRYINNFIFMHAGWSSTRMAAINRWLAEHGAKPRSPLSRPLEGIASAFSGGRRAGMPRPGA